MLVVWESRRPGTTGSALTSEGKDPVLREIVQPVELEKGNNCLCAAYHFFDFFQSGDLQEIVDS